MLKIAVIFMGLLAFKVCLGQTLPLETYTPGNGLVDARVSKMFQDMKGRLFFLTVDGFSIFDGQHFDNYGNDIRQGTGIISDIAEYPNAVVKVFSYDGDIYKVNGNSVELDTSNRGTLKEISKIHSINKTDKILLTNYHLIRERNGHFQLLKLATIKPVFIEASFLIGQYLILIQSNENGSQKILLYDYEKEQIVDAKSLSNIVYYINQLGGQILYSTNPSSWFNIDRDELMHGKLSIKPYDLKKVLPDDFGNFKVQFVADSILWFINPNKGYIRTRLSDLKKEYFPITDGALYSPEWVFEDTEKNYWFGSSGRGVQKLQRSALIKLDKIDGANAGNVKKLNLGEHGQSFINAEGAFFLNEHKIQDVDRGNNSFINWNDQFWQFKDYKTLISSKGHVFALGKLIPGYGPEDFLFSHSFVDRSGRLVISGRIFLFIGKDLSFHYYRPAYFCDNLIQTGIDGFLCFLRNDEVIKIQLKKDEVIKIYHQLIPGLSPRYTIQWDNTTFFCGTRLGGIRILRWVNGQFVEIGAINRPKGLSNNFVNILLKKDQYSLFAGTAAGLDIISLGAKDTTIDNVSQRNSIFLPFVDLVQATDSSLLSRTLDGQLFKLSSLERKMTGFAPQFYFRTIRVNNNEIDTISQKQFSYHKNNFFFSVSSPSFFDSKRIKYNYLLKNKQGDVQWQQNSNSADFEIKNLLPGVYTLIVLVKYPGNVYPEKKLLYSFTIYPPFWKEWWFVLLSAFCILGVMVLLFYWIYRRNLQKQFIKMERETAIEKERTRIALDMHDDFGTNLSRIKFISEKIQLLHKQDIDLIYDLSKISTFSDEMTGKLNEIVWALNQRYDSLDDLIGYCRSFAADFLQDKNIELDFMAPKHMNLKIPGEIRRNIFIVIKESLNNIFKHSGATSVSIEFNLSSQLQILIKDNGKGIDLSNIRPFANGLNNMKARIESVGGQIEIINHAGTEIIVTVPVES
jgi:signal transduction histidine kinase